MWVWAQAIYSTVGECGTGCLYWTLWSVHSFAAACLSQPLWAKKPSKKHFFLPSVIIDKDSKRLVIIRGLGFLSVKVFWKMNYIFGNGALHLIFETPGRAWVRAREATISRMGRVNHGSSGGDASMSMNSISVASTIIYPFKYQTPQKNSLLIHRGCLCRKNADGDPFSLSERLRNKKNTSLFWVSIVLRFNTSLESDNHQLIPCLCEKNEVLLLITSFLINIADWMEMRMTRDRQSEEWETGCKRRVYRREGVVGEIGR